MIHGFKDDKTITAEEWLIDYSLKANNAIDINTDLLNLPIKFDGKKIDAFILDAIDNKLVIQLALPIATKFDAESNVYKTSYIRKLLNSQDFLSRFNQEFVERIKLTTVHTEDYTTLDKLWLLSHEEVGQDVYFLKSNSKCHVFEMFKTIDLATYSQMMLNELNNDVAYGWRLRSVYSSVANYFDSKTVGYIYINGGVGIKTVDVTSCGAVLPACTIC